MNAAKLSMLRRDNFECYLCATNQDLVLHHRANRGMGGSVEKEFSANYLTLCASCNVLIESDADAAETARQRGIKVPNYYDKPLVESTPVMDSRGRKWALLEYFKRTLFDNYNANYGL